MARGSVDIRPLNEVFGIPGVSIWIRSSPLRFGIVRDDKVEENVDSVAGTGTADTSEIIKVNSSATRPAREYCMIIGPAGLKTKRVRKPDSYMVYLQKNAVLTRIRVPRAIIIYTKFFLGGIQSFFLGEWNLEGRIYFFSLTSSSR